MSKIICDVCGTSYPETATQCPICGCVRPGDVVTVAGDTEETTGRSGGTYTHVKGGRFSKSNVKKRNQGKPVPATANTKKAAREDKPGKGEKGLLAAVILLLLAICVVVVYILLRFFAPDLFAGKTETQPVVTTTEPSIVDTVDTVDSLACTDILLSKPGFTFEKAGASYLMNYTTYPADTTDAPVFETSDENVATVTQTGLITAVGPGSAVITVTCGDAIAEFDVNCEFETDGTTPSDASDPSETTEPTETTAPTETTTPSDETTQTTTGDKKLELNRTDMTMSKKGETWKLYSGDIPVDQIAWSSDNEKVVTFKNGTVKAMGMGVTTVRATYAGTEVTCIIRCSETVGVASENPTPDPEESGYTINKTDVTIAVNEEFILKLTDKNGDPVNAAWNIGNSGICMVTGNKVTGKASGITTISVTVEGYLFECIVRVK